MKSVLPESSHRRPPASGRVRSPDNVRCRNSECKFRLFASLSGANTLACAAKARRCSSTP